MATKDVARLEARIDHLAEKIDALTLRMDQHLDGHHGRVSAVKNSGMTAIVAAVVVTIGEVLRRWMF